MIVKLREELEFKKFRHNGNRIRAVRMDEDFMYETCHGWFKGVKGQWLIECAKDMRCVMDDDAFRLHYSFDEE